MLIKRHNLIQNLTPKSTKKILRQSQLKTLNLKIIPNSPNLKKTMILLQKIIIIAIKTLTNKRRSMI